MPSDNLEKFIKENIEAVQHTPPPGSNWNKEAAWLKLQLTPARKRKNTWLYYAAAISVFVLGLGLLRPHWPVSLSVTEPVAETTFVPEILPGTVPSETPIKPFITQEVLPEPVLPEPYKPSIAVTKKISLPEKKEVLQVPQNLINPPTDKVLASVVKEQPEITTAGKTEPSASEPNALAGTVAPPLKITIVLGAASSQRVQNNTSYTNVATKRKKGRLRINIPGTDATGNNHLAVTDSSYKPLTLQARINL